VSGLVESWERFWFEPQETSTLALVRIAFGLVVIAWTLTLAADALDFFGPGGLLPGHTYAGEPATAWSVLDVAGGPVAVTAVMTVLFLAACCLTAGHWTRLAAVLVFVCLVSLERRNPFVFNSGDTLIRIVAFCMMFAPAGAALSVDRLRRAPEAFWEFPRRAPWALRLMQVQLSVVYIASVWTKLRGDAWNDGTAVSYALRLDDLARIQLPTALAQSEIFANLMTYGVLATEAAVGVLVWNRRLRPWVLVAGAALHLGIDLTLRVGFFSWTMLVLYLTFLSPAAARAAVLSVKRRMSERFLFQDVLNPRKEGRSRA
jgi:hypothetical protein